MRVRHPIAWLAVLLGTLLLPAVAVADSASLSVTDPVAGIARVVLVDFQTTNPTSLYVAYRPTGGAPCAPTRSTDSGTSIVFGTDVSGAGQRQIPFTFPSAGPFLVCFWLAPSSGSLPSFATSQMLTVRLPVATLQIATPAPLAGEFGTVTVTGQSEVPRSLYLAIRAAGGAPCAPTRAEDTGNSLISGNDVEGAFTRDARTQFGDPGTRLLCAWLATSSGAIPLATATSTLVVAPLPPTIDVGSPGAPPASLGFDPATQSGAPATPARPVPVSVPPQPGALVRSVTAVVGWRESRLTGNVLLQGRSTTRGRLTVDLLTPAGVARRLGRPAVRNGSFTKRLPLPTGLTPGRYRLRVRGGSARRPAIFRLAVPAPPEGVARAGRISGTPGGAAAAQIPAGATALYASIALTARPRAGRAITFSWYGPDGALVGQPVAKEPAAQIDGFVRIVNAPSGLPSGRWQCVVRAGSVVIARLATTIA